MRIGGCGALVLVVGLLGSGCVVDAIVRDQDNQIDSLQEEANGLRTLVADLQAQVTIKDNERDLGGLDSQLGFLKRLEENGIKVTEEGGTIVVTLVNSILFDSGSAKLKGTAKRSLDEVARILGNKFDDNIIRVEGHTDNDPPKKVAQKYPTNWELSADRATAVLRYLLDRGVGRDMIYSAAFGDTQPIATNSTISGRAQNRRVEIVILPKLAVTKEFFR